VLGILWAVIGASLGWVGFAYLGYPALLAVLRRVAPRPVERRDFAPSLTVLITVYNGERELARKLEETLALEYPGEREVIVASDGSTDASDEIALSFKERDVRLVRNPDRGGKESAQARAIPQARGEILVFTDASARLAPDALREIARPFADPSVGCVSSEDVVDPEQGEGAYVRFEMALRRLESEAATLVGLSGSFFAARRELCQPWPSDLASDFRMGIEAARRGLRAVAEPRARAEIPVTRQRGGEWPRKVRTFRRGIAVLSAYRGLLHPRHGRTALALLGHKAARFTSPFALLACLAASALAAPHSQAAAGLLAAQLAAGALGCAALVWPALGRRRVPRLLGFFLLVNAAVLRAWIHHWSGERAVLWEPTRR
jgi:cellulose synthase/poly-beta-1,6-N-acetylglucosamine synthase-like glycosyltransferase